MRTLTIGSRTFELTILGDPIDDAFDDLYRAWFSKQAPDEQHFDQAAIAFFDTRPGARRHDEYFTSFTILWQENLR